MSLARLVLSRSDDDDLADRLERLGDRGKTGRPDPVVIADQDAVRAGPLCPHRDGEDERQQRGAKNEKATLHAGSVAQNLWWERREADLTFGRLWRRRNLVQHETAPDLFHRHALGFVRMGTMDFAVVFFIEARNSATPKLFGAHGGDVDEQKPAVDWSRFGSRTRRCFGCGCGIQNVFGAVHRSHSLARPPNNSGDWS